MENYFEKFGYWCKVKKMSNVFFYDFQMNLNSPISPLYPVRMKNLPFSIFYLLVLRLPE